MEDWSKYNAEVTKALKDDGTLAEIVENIQSDYDVITGTRSYTEKSYDVYIMFINSTSLNDQIGSDEIMVISSYCEALPIDAKVKNLYLKHQEQKYEIVKSKAVRPGGVIIFHKLVCKA